MGSASVPLPGTQQTETNVATASAAQSARFWTAIVIAVTFVVHVYFVLAAGDAVSTERILLGSVSLWVVVPPIVAFIHHRAFTFMFGPLALIGYVIYFVRGVFQSDLSKSDLVSAKGFLFTEPQLVDAAWVVLLGISGFSFALLIAFSRPVQNALPRIVWPVDPQSMFTRLTLTGLLAPLIRLVFHIVTIPAGAVQPLIVVMNVAECAGLIVLCTTFKRGGAWTWHPWAALLSIVLSAGVGIGTSLVAEAATVLFVPAFAYIGIRRRLPVLVTILGVLVLAPLLYSRHDFRQEYGHRDYDLESSAQFVQFSFDSLKTKSFSLDDFSEMMGSRFNMFGTLAHVVSSTPGRIPLWDGETYLPTLVAPIPRFLWPDKPTQDSGQQFGHRFELLDEGDFATSFNLAQLIELRANFNTGWVLLGMFIIGFIEVFISAPFRPSRSRTSIAWNRRYPAWRSLSD